MTEEREELPEETAQSQLEPAPAEQDEETWLHIILGIPYIGEFLTAVIGVFPMILIFAASEMLFGVEPEAETRNEISTAEFWTVLAGIPVLYAWLRYLERKLRLAICLPLPIVSIRLKWLLIPFGLFWIYLFVAGDTL